MSGSTSAVRLIGATATVLLAAACGSSGTATYGGGAGASRAASSGPALSVATTSLGPVLVNSKGFTVYLLTADRPGHSSCSAQCLQYWPLVPGAAGASSAKGVSAALATTKASSGAPIETAGGWPLYTFVKDQAPGEVTGQGVKTFGGTWYAVSPSGAPVTGSAKGAPATSGPANGGNGY